MKNQSAWATPDKQISRHQDDEKKVQRRRSLLKQTHLGEYGNEKKKANGLRKGKKKRAESSLRMEKNWADVRERETSELVGGKEGGGDKLVGGTRRTEEPRQRAEGGEVKKTL